MSSKETVYASSFAFASLGDKYEKDPISTTMYFGNTKLDNKGAEYTREVLKRQYGVDLYQSHAYNKRRLKKYAWKTTVLTSADKNLVDISNIPPELLSKIQAKDLVAIQYAYDTKLITIPFTIDVENKVFVDANKKVYIVHTRIDERLRIFLHKLEARNGTKLFDNKFIIPFNSFLKKDSIDYLNLNQLNFYEKVLGFTDNQGKEITTNLDNTLGSNTFYFTPNSPLKNPYYLSSLGYLNVPRELDNVWEIGTLGKFKEITDNMSTAEYDEAVKYNRSLPAVFVAPLALKTYLETNEPELDIGLDKPYIIFYDHKFDEVDIGLEYYEAPAITRKVEPLNVNLITGSYSRDDHFLPTGSYIPDGNAELTVTNYSIPNEVYDKLKESKDLEYLKKVPVEVTYDVHHRSGRTHTYGSLKRTEYVSFDPNVKSLMQYHDGSTNIPEEYKNAFDRLLRIVNSETSSTDNITGSNLNTKFDFYYSFPMKTGWGHDTLDFGKDWKYNSAHQTKKYHEKSVESNKEKNHADDLKSSNRRPKTGKARVDTVTRHKTTVEVQVPSEKAINRSNKIKYGRKVKPISPLDKQTKKKLDFSTKDIGIPFTETYANLQANFAKDYYKIKKFGVAYGSILGNQTHANLKYWFNFIKKLYQMFPEYTDSFGEPTRVMTFYDTVGRTVEENCSGSGDNRTCETNTYYDHQYADGYDMSTNVQLLYENEAGKFGLSFGRIFKHRIKGKLNATSRKRGKYEVRFLNIKSHLETKYRYVVTSGHGDNVRYYWKNGIMHDFSKILASNADLIKSGNFSTVSLDNLYKKPRRAVYYKHERELPNTSDIVFCKQVSEDEIDVYVVLNMNFRCILSDLEINTWMPAGTVMTTYIANQFAPSGHKQRLGYPYLNKLTGISGRGSRISSLLRYAQGGNPSRYRTQLFGIGFVPLDMKLIKRSGLMDLSRSMGQFKVNYYEFFHSETHRDWGVFGFIFTVVAVFVAIYFQQYEVLPYIIGSALAGQILPEIGESLGVPWLSQLIQAIIIIISIYNAPANVSILVQASQVINLISTVYSGYTAYMMDNIKKKSEEEQKAFESATKSLEEKSEKFNAYSDTMINIKQIQAMLLDMQKTESLDQFLDRTLDKNVNRHASYTQIENWVKNKLTVDPSLEVKEAIFEDLILT